MPKLNPSPVTVRYADGTTEVRSAASFGKGAQPKPRRLTRATRRALARHAALDAATAERAERD